MNLLFYCDEYPPVRSGGIGSATKIVAEELVRRGHNVVVYGNINQHFKIPEYQEINGVKIYRRKCFRYLEYVPSGTEKYVVYAFSKVGINSRISHKGLIETEKNISDLIKKEKIELIELVDYMMLINSLNKDIMLTKFSIPTVMRVHGSRSFLEFHQGRLSKLTQNKDKSNFARADYYCAVSKYSADFATKHFQLESRKTNVIYNPIETSFIVDNGEKEIEDIILFIGKIIETKGAFSVLKAFNVLSKNHKSIKLVLVGGGAIKKGKSLVKKEIRDRVIFKGYISRTELLEEIDKCKFAVIPSYFENFSMVALEVMARSKALIYTNRTSGAEIISDYYDGILVDPEDIDSIVYNMNFLLTNDHLRSTIEKNAFRKLKENFTENMIVNQLEDYYKSIIFKA